MKPLPKGLTEEQLLRMPEPHFSYKDFQIACVATLVPENEVEDFIEWAITHKNEF